MINLRKEIEENELKYLATYATKSSRSRGRKFSEKQSKTRTCFQRDKDRVLHSASFRRLNGKTQVFSAVTTRDHVRNRLTHTTEVVQIARSLARSLGLNEDLTEVIALSHDLGHTPYGHCGQDALNDCMQPFNMSFEHNLQSKRIVEKLEQRTTEYQGLNLSLEVLEGLGKHDEVDGREEGAVSNLEGQVVNIADGIAYLTGDVDDALRSKLVTLEDFNALKIVRNNNINCINDFSDKIGIKTLSSHLISAMVKDALYNTHDLLLKNRINSTEDVRSFENILVKFSDEFYDYTRELKSFLMEGYYNNPIIISKMNEGKKEIQTLFEYYMKNLKELPLTFHDNISSDGLERCVSDHISGMTDRFAHDKYRQVITDQV